MTRVSGLINTLREADNIRFSVTSLTAFCDEVVVVDQESGDGTAEIAERAGARVLSIPRTGWVEVVRERSVAETTGDWILILDADEIVPPTLGPRLREIAESDDWDVVLVPRRNIILGRWLRHGDWWPNAKPRFFRRGMLYLRPEMHSGLVPVEGARILTLPADPDLALHHFSYHTLHDVVEKTNRYTTVQARLRSRRTHRLRVRDWFRAAWLRAWVEVVRRGAWRDGPVGIAVVVIRIFDRFLVKAKEWDEEASATRLAEYRRQKAELLGIPEEEPPV